MNLSMTGSLADRFKSASQKAGNVTEAWGAENFYCPNCSSPKLDWLKPGTKASDYKCPNCNFWFQLKSKKSPIGKSIRDGAYAAMMEAIREDHAPSYYFLHYDLATWSVRNLLLVPSFAFPPSAIIQCPPLSSTARRAGWVGCNFDLSRVPAEARIEIISTRSSGRESAPSNQSRLTSAATFIVLPSEVREKFRKVKPLKDISVRERGWTLDVLNGVRSLDKKEFTNTDAYTLAGQLEKLHPDNRHIRDKIRQQLQVLRDAKLLIHVSSGLWRLP
jgi:type II restriction enzyme